MFECFFFFQGTARRNYLEKNSEYDDCEITATKYAKNNLKNWQVSVKRDDFLRIDGVTNDPPLTDVTIFVVKERQ